MSNKKLIIVFVILAAIYAISKFVFGNKESSFNPQVITVDTAKVTEIRLFPKAEEGAQITLRKSPKGWTVSKDDKTFDAPYSKVGGLLGQLRDIESERIVSRSKDKWADYEVDDKGTRVVVLDKDKTLADFVVGTFKVDQQRRSASTYLRTSDDDAVYIVDGFMSMTFNQHFDSYRNGQILKLNKADITGVTVDAPSGQADITLNTGDGHWYHGGNQLDSARTAQYITQLTNVYGTEFVDEPVTGQPVTSLEVKANNQVTPLKVDCYERPDSTYPYVLHSTANPDSWFATDSAGLYSRLFVKFDELISGQ